MDKGPGEKLSLKISRSKLVKLADMIVIDEISLVPPDLFDSVVLSIQKAEEVTGKKKKLVVLGDMLQLAPTLPRDSPHRRLLEAYYGTSHDNWMAFMGHCWDECCFETVLLTEAMRQKNEEFVRSQSGYFYRRNLYGEEVLRSDYDIVFPADSDVYLGVAVARRYDTPLDVLYGWVQFHRDEGGAVSFVTSALDLTGDSVVVGGIPEPSSALLLLVGFGLLATRRKR